MDAQRPFCRRCLLEDMSSEAELLRSIEELISLLPPEKRADDATRAQRLSMCRECDHLRSGTCLLCGCFVELRTAKAHMACPDVPARWQSVTKGC